MEFRVGEKVRIKKQLAVGRTKSGLWINRYMKMYCGEEFLVKTSKGNLYELGPINKKSRSGVSNWFWDEFCLEKCAIKFR